MAVAGSPSTATLPHTRPTKPTAGTGAAAAATSLTPAQREQWTADAKQSQTTGVVVLVLVVVFLVVVFSYVLIYIVVRARPGRIELTRAQTHALHPHAKVRRAFSWLPGALGAHTRALRLSASLRVDAGENIVSAP